MENECVMDGEEGEPYDHIGDVFQNNVIMGTFLRLVPVNDVLKCRLLNRLCNQIGCTVLNSIRPQTRRIWTQAGMEKFLTTFGKRDPETMFPYTAFELELWDIPLELIQHFVQLVGPRVMEYKVFFLKNSGFSTPTASELSEHQVTAKVVTLLSTCPKLETLDLRDRELSYRWTELDSLPKSFPTLRLLVSQGISNLMEGGDDLTVYVARRAPQLDGIKFLLKNRGYPQRALVLNQLPEFLYDVCVKPPKLTLHTQLLQLGNSSEIFDRITGRNYNRLLSFRFKGVLEMSEQFLTSLYNLLELQSETLEDFKMKIALVKPETGFPLRFPRLKKLKKMKIVGFRHNPHLVLPFESLQFPQLRVMELGIYTPLRWFSETFLAPSLVSLTIINYIGSAENETLHLNFPNLKALKVSGYEDISLPEYILSRMTGLEELTLGHSNSHSRTTLGQEMWSIYTGGVSRLVDGTLCKVPENLQGISADNAAGLVPSLGNLSALKKLTLTVTSVMEVEALAYASSCGVLRGLEELLISFAVAEDHPSYRDFKGYDARSNDLLFYPDCKTALDKCHKIVRYRYVFY